MTLYEMTTEYQTLLDLLEDGEAPEEAVNDTLSMVLEDIGDKAEGYGIVLKQMQADAEALKAEKQRIAARQAGIEKNIERLRNALLRAMQITGQAKLKTKLFTLSVRNTEKVVLDLPVEEIPVDFWKPVKPEADLKAIGQWIKEGHEPDFAHFEPATSLTVR